MYLGIDFEVFLVSYASFGGSGVGNILAKMEQAGVFQYLLPGLIIFALVYTVLSFIKVFRNRAIISVIALTTSLLALQFDLVGLCFAEIFPRLGIALSILLIIIILGGVFFEPKDGESKWIKVVLTIITIGAIIFVLIGSLECMGFRGIGFLGGGFTVFYNLNWARIIGILLVVGVFFWIIKTTNSREGGSGRSGGWHRPSRAVSH